MYADFECNLRGAECYEGSYKKYQDHIPSSFAYQVGYVDNRFTKQFVVYKGENATYEFTKAILKEYKYWKKVINKHFNKYLIVSEEKDLFQQSSSCWICKKLIDNNEKKKLEIIVT